MDFRRSRFPSASDDDVIIDSVRDEEFSHDLTEKLQAMGTVGYSVFRNEDDGKPWSQSDISSGLPFGTRVCYLGSHSRTPEAIFAGTDYGLVRSDDGGA